MRNSITPRLGAAVITAAVLLSTPLHAAVTGDQIETSFKESHVYRTLLNEDAVTIKAEDGVVTLSGTVARESNRQLAEDTAAGLNGVTRVVNTIETEEEAAMEKSDTWIERKLNFALLFRRDVSMSQTTVSVSDGVVTLGGEATSQAQKDLTAEYASGIDGVESVVNNMTVAAAPLTPVRSSGEKIDDASVTARVKGVLAGHRSTRAATIGVVTLNGEVTLTGIAGNAAEKRLAGKIVSDVDGVKKVRNQMTVNPFETR